MPWSRRAPGSRRGAAAPPTCAGRSSTAWPRCSNRGARRCSANCSSAAPRHHSRSGTRHGDLAHDLVRRPVRQGAEPARQPERGAGAVLQLLDRRADGRRRRDCARFAGAGRHARAGAAAARRRQQRGRAGVSESAPFAGLALGEVCASSDVPAGAINLLSGLRSELAPQFASHRDLDGLLVAGAPDAALTQRPPTTASACATATCRCGLEQGAQLAFASRSSSQDVWHPVRSSS
jgi:hypothetical protein